jgi:hypothetical protein
LKLYGRWKVTLPPEEWVWEPDEITFDDQLLIENEADASYDEWIMTGIRDSRAEACQILIWFLRRKAGQQEDRFAVRPTNIRHLDLEKLDDEVDADPEADAASEAATSSPSTTGTESNPGNGVDSPALTSVV